MVVLTALSVCINIDIDGWEVNTTIQHSGEYNICLSCYCFSASGDFYNSSG